tara:strand:- start:32918 stop:33820 length:903 start_codon:yes stop_codon:yes gene_type:complete
MNFSDHGDNNSKDYNAGLRDNDYRVYEMDLQCEAGYLSRPLDENWSAKIRESDPLYVKTEQGGVMTKRMLNYTLKKCLFVSALNDKLSSDWSNFLTTRSCDDLTVENKNYLLTLSEYVQERPFDNFEDFESLEKAYEFHQNFLVELELAKKGRLEMVQEKEEGSPSNDEGSSSKKKLSFSQKDHEDKVYVNTLKDWNLKSVPLDSTLVICLRVSQNNGTLSPELGDLLQKRSCDHLNPEQVNDLLKYDKFIRQNPGNYYEDFEALQKSYDFEQQLQARLKSWEEKSPSGFISYLGWGSGN